MHTPVFYQFGALCIIMLAHIRLDRDSNPVLVVSHRGQGRGSTGRDRATGAGAAMMAEHMPLEHRAISMPMLDRWMTELSLPLNFESIPVVS